MSKFVRSISKFTIKGIALAAMLLGPSLLHAASLSGTVTDVTTKAPLINASVIVEGTTTGSSTDAYGRYNITGLPTGFFVVRVSMLGYQEKSIQNVEIHDGTDVKLDIALTASSIKLETAKVAAGARKSSNAGAIQQRMKSAGITDNLSGDMLKSLPDPDLAQVVRRVTGVTTDAGDPIIRGLGPRYSKVTMNNSQMSGTEPNKSGVSLDLFPASMIQSVKVNKSYQADQFGEFAGGVIDMNTWDFVAKDEFSVGYTMGYKPDITFKSARTYKGGSYDFLGFDDGDRALPNEISDSPYKISVRGRSDTAGYTASDIERLGELFDNNWNTHSFQAPPNTGVNLSYASGIPIAGKKLNFIASGLFKNSNSYKSVHRNLFRAGAGGDVELQHWYDFNYWEQSATLAGITSLFYDFSPLHRLSGNVIYNHDASDETRTYEGYNSDRDKILRDTRLKLTIEEIVTSQVSGRHAFPSLAQSTLTWQFTHSESQRNEPDTREVQYDKSENDTAFRLANEPKSGSRIFFDLNEHTYTEDINWQVRVLPSLSVKVGAAFIDRQRDSQQRFFLFVPRNGVNNPVYFQDPEVIYSPDNITSTGVGVSLRETSRSTDSYAASHGLQAWYINSDAMLTPKLRLIAGLRHESSVQQTKSYQLYTATETPTKSTIDTKDFLPALSLIYTLQERTNIRFSASQTLARPDFREITSFEFTDITGGRATVGNPSLTRTLIRNYDIRYDKSTGTANLFSVSLFYKHFIDPIEAVIQPTAQLRTSFENAAAAENYGVEFEILQELGDIDQRLANWGVTANLTLMQSDIQLTDSSKSIQTSKRRPLHGQSPYLVNAGVQYKYPRWKTRASLFLNVFGKRINEVGAVSLPDVYEMPHPDLDLSVQQPVGERWNFKANITNLLDSKRMLKQGSEIAEEYREGISISAGFTYKI